MILEQIDEYGKYLGIGIVGILFLLVFLRVYHRRVCCCHRGSDVPNYGSIANYVHSCLDLWTDILFVYAMYLKNETMYFYFSLLFTIIPMCCSICLVIYWIRRWQNENAMTVSHRIKDYLSKYSIVLIIFTLIGDFYSCVLLLQTKLLCMQMFNFPLKRKESDSLIVYKFVNVSLFEV